MAPGVGELCAIGSTATSRLAPVIFRKIHVLPRPHSQPRRILIVVAPAVYKELRKISTCRRPISEGCTHSPRFSFANRKKRSTQYQYASAVESAFPWLRIFSLSCCSSFMVCLKEIYLRVYLRGISY